MSSFLKFTSPIERAFPKPFIGSYVRAFGTASPSITQTPQQAKKDPSTISKETKKSLEIKSSWDNARIIDFRDHFNPLNKVAVFCPHASNILPEPYKWSEHDKYFIDKHWARDLGAVDMAIALAQELQCVVCHALYSRLLVDTNRGVYEEDLFRKEGDGVKVELNANLSDEEKTSRITKYHASYYNAGREILQKVDPDIIFSIHSFTPIYEGKTRDIEVGFEYVASEGLAKKLYEKMKPRGYKVGLNQPYTGDLGYSLKVVLREQVPRKIEGVCFEIRNDILLDKQRFNKLKEDLLDVIRLTCFSEDDKLV